MKKDSNIVIESISIVVIIILLVFSLFTIYKTYKCIDSNKYKKYRIESVVQDKGITSEFLLSYILPLVAFDFTLWEGVIQFLIYFSVVSFLCIRNNNVYANFLFECVGYKFYNCDILWIAEKDTEPIQATILSKENL